MFYPTMRRYTVTTNFRQPLHNLRSAEMVRKTIPPHCFDPDPRPEMRLPDLSLHPKLRPAGCLLISGRWEWEWWKTKFAIWKRSKY